jgi:periplasmic divalent cation tolerance protein
MVVDRVVVVKAVAVVVNMNTIALLYTTITSLDEAEKLAEKAVIEKYAACVNIIPHATSVYMWEGKVEKSTECFLLFKTSVERIEELQVWLKEHHPYAVPAVLQGTVESSVEFQQYVHDNVRA